MDTAQYAQQLMALLPRGAAWPREEGTNLDRLIYAYAVEFARVDARAEDIVRESDPRTAIELMAEWETVTGLPDECTGPAETMPERRARLVQKLTTLGGQSRQFFTDVAGALGYAVTITEFRPFICGVSRCGEHELNGGDATRHYWRVSVPDPRLTRFCCGASTCGEPLLSIATAEDLECILSRLKPAHTTLILDYQGA